MKKRVMLLGMGVIGLILAGCIVPSIYPFYTDKDLVEEPALVGTWISTNAEAKDPLIFSRVGEKEYRMVVKNGDGSTNEMSLHFFKLDGQLFMDWMAAQQKNDDAMYFVPTHMLGKISEIKPLLIVEELNYDFFTNLLEKDPKAIRHIKRYDPKDDSKEYIPVLTADTAELQAFLRKNMSNTNLFSPPNDAMRKVK